MKNKFQTTKFMQSHKRGYRCLQDGQEITDVTGDGFNWGYGGSGPNNLAYAILYEHTGNRFTADRLKRQLVQEHISKWETDGTYEFDLEAWVESHS